MEEGREDEECGSRGGVDGVKSGEDEEKGEEEVERK